MSHELEANTDARAAFDRMGRAAQSGFRQALRYAGMPPPSWAADRRVGRNVERSNVEHCDVAQSVASPADPTDDELNALFEAA
ncbi:hypothetical protein M3I54_39940 [Paraburkholderia sp. CNPSo 3274]|uniref:hypothetical protein n=1 Tax=Paraburkholderia sp. CNPSo 3274 TaxID=2940932 RepID=UPI0020B6D841|nr:hypothetical protein [Paraburkholderia sp. CNPSo 3274]MCP3712995.1 hypothetical protein [Paraburkholderia sp. CNPSo 3274]